MATELVAGASQLRFRASNAERSKELRTGIAGQLFQVTTPGRGALVICNISHWRPRGNHAKPRIKSCEFAQERLEGRLSQPSLLSPRRILERFQAVQNQQSSTMRDELRQSFAFLPCRSDPWIWVTKPTKSPVKKFIRGRSPLTG